MESGARPEHVLYMLNNFTRGNLKEVDGFCRYTLGLERGTKHCFYIYMRRKTAKGLESLSIGKDAL